MNAEYIFKLTWKRVLLIVLAWLAAFLLHNVVSAILGIEEPFFFIVAVIFIPLYFLVSLGYTLVKLFVSRN